MRSPRESQTTTPRVLVALSGGVDSAVAAALLVEQGYDVIGATLHLWAERGSGDVDAERLARRVAEMLDIPFHLINAESAFKERVVDYFVAEYGAGRTPSPCVLCNRFVRFGFLLDRALAMGATGVATGHYARVRRSGERYQLLRGRDSGKDQSYFLHALSQRQLSHALFPLGELTKVEVRAIARERGLPVAGAPESQDICFLAQPDYRRFLAAYAPDLFRPGPIRDSSGRVVGQHRGLPGYTVGQRKGLDVPASEPLYVLTVRPAENTLIVGTADELGQEECVVEKMHYVSGETISTPFRSTAQVRYRARPSAVTVTPLGSDGIHARFSSPQRAVAPGQFLVLYDGDVVLGGGAIS